MFKILSKNTNKFREELNYSRCQIYQYNEDDFRLKFLLSTKLSSMNTHKHGNKEKLLIKSFFYLLFEESLNWKSRLYCIDVNAAHCG